LAVEGLEQIYRPGFAFPKAKILLLDLCQRGQFTEDLFAPRQSSDAQKVMAVLDAINNRWGRGTLCPWGVPVSPGWGMKRELLSPSYTTRIDQILAVSAK